MSKETRQDREARLKNSTESEVLTGADAAQGENPEPGENGHKCMMPDGRYNPEWKSILVSANAETPDRIYVQSRDGAKRVKSGVWVDVPPEIADALVNAGHDQTITDNTKELGGPGQGETVVKRVQRFSVSVRDSA